MIKKILVPLDGSSLAEKALPHAERLAHQFEAELILARVLAVAPDLVVAGPRGMVFHDQADAARQAAQIYLDRIWGRLRGHHVSARSVVLEAHPVAEALVNLARREKVDLIVMSTHSRSEVSRWLYGSVATKVLQHAPCPIFLVRDVDTN